MKKGADAYRNINTMGMSQLDLILTVYRGALDYLQLAKKGFAEERFDGGRENCEKARKCLVHLYATLDIEKGQAIARQLGQLYAFMIERLDLALASKSSRDIDDIIGILTTLKEGWDGLKAGDAAPAAENSMATSPASSGPARITLSA
jgi:flagellar secretion chaperone FliS